MRLCGLCMCLCVHCPVYDGAYAAQVQRRLRKACTDRHSDQYTSTQAIQAMQAKQPQGGESWGGQRETWGGAREMEGV